LNSQRFLASDFHSTIVGFQAIAVGMWRTFYSDSYTVELPEKHRFPMHKYRALRDQLVERQLLRPEQLEEAPLARYDDLVRAHDAEYVDRFMNNQQTEAEVRRMGFPWSTALVRRTLASTGGCVAASQAALTDGIASNLAGGTHHAHRDFASGFCIFNDIAVAALKLVDQRLASRILIVDLDVHQGDGNSSILGPTPEVFVFSVHGEKNFPFRKVDSDLDIGLPNGTEDSEYLAAVEEGLNQAFAFRPDFVFYQAGVDPLEQDALGKLSVSHAGLRTRDRMVLERTKALGVPVCLTLGGGYSRPIEPTLEAYCGTYQVMGEIYDQPTRRSSLAALESEL
jgi:acetoin utilization deacetylase AcuC-like enzyme